MRRLRLSIVGFGTVGRWLANAVHRRRSFFEEACVTSISVVAVSTRRDGYVLREDGLDVPTLLRLAAARRPLAEHPGSRRYDTSLEGLAHSEYEVLAEASHTDPRSSEPALGHLRRALRDGRHAITSSKGPCASAAIELAALARERGVEFRMESTVMSGTPVLSTIAEGLAGARVTSLRGIVNATANHILTSMAEGLDYSSALAEAQRKGYAEPDPADDVEGHDAVAKARILAAVAFGESVALEEVYRRGITDLTAEDIEAALRADARLKLVATVRPAHGPQGSRRLEVRVEPVALPLRDPLARVDGVMNALEVQTDTVSEVLLVGPGAGRAQAGQGLLADLVAVARAPLPLRA
jgi:homoserine dehydrogenase